MCYREGLWQYIQWKGFTGERGGACVLQGVSYPLPTGYIFQPDARFFVNNSISVHFNVDWGLGIGLAHCIHKVFKLRWKSGLKSPESWSNVTEVGTEVLLGPNLGDILADFDQGSGSRPPRLPPQFGDLWMQCANPMSKPQSTLKWIEIELLTKNRAYIYSGNCGDWGNVIIFLEVLDYLSVKLARRWTAE